jgi:hypothetical protein
MTSTDTNLGEDTPLTNLPVAKNLIDAGADIRSIVPQNFDEALRIGKVLAKAEGAIPKDYVGKPEMIAAVIMRGLDVKFPPMQALSTIAVINGRSAIWGSGIKALILRSGHRLEVSYEGGKGDVDRVAIARLTREDTGQVFEASFGYQDAKRAKLLEKDTYQKYPDRMFQARAIGFVTSDGAADVLMGLEVREAVEDSTPMREVNRRGSETVLGRRMRGEEPRQEVVDAEVVNAEAGGTIYYGDQDITPDEAPGERDAQDDGIVDRG